MLEIGLFWLGLVFVVISILMLFWDSFKQRKLWGLAGLLLILPLIVHMIMNWSSLSVRKACYLLIVGLLTILVSVVGGALAQLPFIGDHKVVQALEENIAPPKQEQPLPNQAQADAAKQAVDQNYDPLLTGSEYEDLPKEQIIPDDVNVTHPKTSSARFQTITAEERQYALYKWVRLSLASGEIIEGRLSDILEDAVLIESIVNGGVLGLSYANNDINQMSVRLEPGEELIVPTVGVDETETPEQNEMNSDDANSRDIDIAVDQVDNEINIPDTQEESMSTEQLSPELEVLENTDVQNETQQVLESIDAITDDSKSVDTPLTE